MFDPAMMQQFGQLPGQDPEAMRRQMMGRMLAQHASTPQGTSPFAGASQIGQGALAGFLMRPQMPTPQFGQIGSGMAQGMGGMGLQLPMFGGQ